MRKQKKNNLIKLAGLVILVLALALTFVACGDPENPSDNDNDGATGVTEVTLPVKNGNFEYATGTSYPKTPKNWTYSTGYILTSSDEPHAYNGVIAVDDDSFSAYSESYHLSANPSQKGTDGYVLMLNNVLPYHTAYTSETVTINKGKYYELVVYVKTALAEGSTGGAYVYLENDANNRVFKSFNKVSANDWTAYSFWIEASKSSNMSVKLKLALGSGDAKYHADLTSGSAFFDSVAITEKTKEEYDAIVEGTTANALKYSFALRNAEFTETSSDVVSTKPVTPYDWTSYVGRDDNGSSIAPTSGLYRGVIDTTYAPTTGALKDQTITSASGQTNDNMLMIYLSNEERPSAYSYYSNAITFEFDKAYELTFKVRTAGLKNIDKSETLSDKQGVSVKLGEDITLFEGIKTDGEWDTYTAYILGSPTQPKNYSLYFWLGQGHEGDKDNYLSGAAFFDSITLKEITIDAYKLITVDPADTKVKKYAMTAENLLTVAPFSGTDTVPTYWTGDFVENHGDALTRKTILRTVDLSAYATDSQIENKKLTASDPGIPVNNRENKNQALALFNQTANAYEANLTTNFTIKPNLSYRLSFWVKTDSIKEGKGATFTLVQNDEDKTTLATLSSVNTATFDEDGNVESNEWTEIVFAIQGNQTDSNEVTLKVTLGSGDMYNPDYLSGTVFMSNMYLESLTAKEYSNVTTSSYIAKHSFRQTASTQIVNGNFNNIDVDKSELDENGKLNGKPGAVQSWTSSFADDAQSKLADNVVTGIIDKDLYDSSLTEVQSLGSTPFFGSNDASVYNGGPNLLMIYNKVATEYGYTSASSSLTASSYYKVTVNVKTAGNAKAKIIVKNNGKDTLIDNVDTQDAWKTYTVFIKVGLNSSNVKLYLGLKSEGAGVAFFDNANYASIDKDTYDKATANNSDVLKINLNFDSFNTSEVDFPATPTNYNGEVLGTAPSTSADYATGILDKNHVDAVIEDTFNLTANDVEPVDGTELLAIYNKNDTAYAYTSSSYTFNANTFYKVTANVKTKDLQDGDKAKITLTLSSTETAVFYSNDTTWKTYTFYVKMDDSALNGVTISLGLGEFNKGDDGKAITADYAKGYAFFDEIGIEEIDEATYTAKVGAITAETTDVKKIDVVVANQNAESNDDDTDSDESLTSSNSLSAWEIVAIVSASLLSVALIAVMIVVFVKRALPKIKEKKNKKYKKPSYDKRASKVATKDDLDKFKD